MKSKYEWRVKTKKERASETTSGPLTCRPILRKSPPSDPPPPSMSSFASWPPISTIHNDSGDAGSD